MSGVAADGLARGPAGRDALLATGGAAGLRLQAETEAASATAASPTAANAGARPGLRPAPGRPGRSVISPAPSRYGKSSRPAVTDEAIAQGAWVRGPADARTPRVFGTRGIPIRSDDLI